MVNLRKGRRAALLIAAVVAIVVGGLAGSAGTGQAATSFTVSLQSAVGSDVNTVSTVSLGGKIGEHLHVENTGDSTTTQVQVFVRSELLAGADAVATFVDASDPSCAAIQGDTTKMICTPDAGTMKPGETFDVDFRFLAPTSGTQVSLTAYVVIAAQSVGGKKNGNNGTTVATSNTVPTSLVAGGDTQNTFLRANEKAFTGNLSSGHPQKFSLQAPGSLFGAFAVAVGIHDQTTLTPICESCLPSFTSLTIPLAHFVSTSSSYPFYDPLTNTFYPYAWSIDAQYKPGFQLHGVFHVDDNSVLQQLASCTSIGGAPTAAEPLCYDTLTQDNVRKTVAATGRGLENGLFGLG